MKKSLLSAVAICCFCAAPAQEAPIPFQSYNAVLTNISSNGEWAVGSTEGIGYFVNAKTGKLTVYNEKGLTYDINSVADCGIAAGSYTPSYGKQLPCYVTEEKGYVPLPLPEGITSGVCKGASADGSFLAGNVWITKANVGRYTQPVVWYRNESGGYDAYEELPFNKIGFDNSHVQGTWILGVSSDGLKLYGRLVDRSGTVYQPVLWERSSTDSHEWTYKELCSDYCFNKDVPAPEFPQYEPSEPDVTQYYNEEELAAYNKALDLYNDSVAKASWTIPKDERGPYPTYNPEQHKTDFFDTSTADGVDRCNKYSEAYNGFLEDAVAYNDSIELYYERYDEYVIYDKRFYILNMSLSNNGKYMVTTTVSNMVMINPETEEITILEGADGLFPSGVLDDGTVFIGQKAAMPPLDRIPYVYKDGVMMDFGDWLRKHSEKAYNDLLEACPDGHFGVVNTNNPEGLTFCGFNQTLEYGNVGWIMNLGAYDDFGTGIADNKISEDDINISLNSESGSIEIAGTDKADVRIYSVNGSCVYSAAGVSGRVSVPSLSHGTYIVEVKSGSSVVRKKMMLM